MKFANISVIGLGLIGGSLCKALKKSGRVGKVTGVDSDKSVVDYALYNDFVDDCTTSFMRGVSKAEIVVICTYVDTIAGISEDIKDLVPGGCVITDVGSVKSAIVERVSAIMPEGKFFVGGHPIAGTERSGIQNSDPLLYRNKRIFLTPAETTDESAIERVREMWELTGGSVSTMPPDLHDTIFSLVSHLPHVVAYSLIDAVSARTEDVANIFDYAGGGLRDFTRVTSSSPHMWKEILMMNRDNVLKDIKNFRKSLKQMEEAIESDDGQSLLDFLSRASEQGKNDQGSK